MRKLGLLLICFLSLSLVLPIIAQDDSEEEAFDCSTLEINRQVDNWYNEYIADRGEFETNQTLDAAQVLADQLNALTEACAGAPDPVNEDSGVDSDESVESANEEPAEQTGIGTFDSPFIIQAPGIVGVATVDIIEGILPANDLIAEANIPGTDNIPEGQEYFVVYLSVACESGAINSCNINRNSFRAVGDLEVEYEAILSEFDDFLPGPTPLNGGADRTGAIPFLVDEDDTTLRLVYYPEGDADQDGAMGFYFDAQGSANSFEVRSTTAELIIRNAPVNGAPIGVLRSNQVGIANGRNADTSWIFIEAPEGTGWVSADFITSDSDLETLEIIETEE